MNLSTRISNSLTLAALTLSLAGCGGGGSDSSESAVAAAPPPSPGTTLPTTPPTAYTPDLRSFAVAWVGLQIAGTALDVLHITGETGNCGAGGSTRYDFGAVRQTLSQCVVRTSPDSAYTGSWSATNTTTGKVKSVAMSSPSLTVANPVAAGGQTQFAITAGNVGGLDDFSNDAVDVYSAVGFSLEARVGTANAFYRVGSNAAATASQSIQNGVATLLISSASLGVDYSGNAWRFTVQNLRSIGDNRPDQGTLIVADQSQPSTAATTVTFGTGNGLQFSSGGQSVVKRWSDADVQAALAAARQ